MAALIETMVSANDIVPWHKQGKVLSGYPSIDVMFDNSGLDWKVEKRPLLFKSSDGSIIDSGKFGIIRNTDDAFLGVSSDRYVLYQNEDAFKWCKQFTDTGLWVMETAGALKGGKVCWALLNQGSDAVGGVDEIKNYLLLNWAHDGSQSVQVGRTSIRVVCNNTLRFALRRDRDTISSVSHNSRLQYRLDQIGQLYRENEQAFSEQFENFEKMFKKRLAKFQQEEYVVRTAEDITSLVADSDELRDNQRAEKRFNKVKDDLTYCINNGTGIATYGLRQTAWGTFNGVEEYIEKWRSPGRIKDRGSDVLFGVGNKLINNAYNRMLAIAA